MQPPEKPKPRYNPKNVKGQWFVYDEEKKMIPLGFGNIKGRKQFIQNICNHKNNEA